MKNEKISSFFKATLIGGLIGLCSYHIAKYIVAAILMLMKKFFMILAVAAGLYFGIKMCAKMIGNCIRESKKKKFDFEPERVVYCDFEGNVFA